MGIEPSFLLMEPSELGWAEGRLALEVIEGGEESSRFVAIRMVVCSHEAYERHSRTAPRI